MCSRSGSPGVTVVREHEGLFVHAGSSESGTFVLDVGGGSVGNDVEHNLARIPLRWMIRQCFLTNTGILFNSAGIRKIGLDPAALYPKVLERPPALYVPPSDVKKDTPLTEEEHDAIDALCPMYDELRRKYIWWLLEMIPARWWVRTEENKWLNEIT